MAESFLQNSLCRILSAVYPGLMEHSDATSHGSATPNPAHEHPETLPGGLPEWFDPRQDAMLTPSRLRGLVHPIRVRLLRLLLADGPATATQLGRKLGQSSGVTSYHLRMLADLGFIVEDTERSTGRDRYWRSRYSSSSFTFRAPDDPGTPETVEMAVQYIRMSVEQAFSRTLGYLDAH